MTKMWWSELMTGESSIPTQTKAAKVWRSIQKWAHVKIRQGHYRQQHFHSTSSSSNATTNQQHQDECVYASGLAGCLSPGRYVIHVSKSMKRTFDKVIEDYVGVVSEGSEDDLDFLDTATRVVGKTGWYVGNVIVKAVQQNSYRVELCKKRIRYIIGFLKVHFVEIQKILDALKEFLFEVH